MEVIAYKPVAVHKKAITNLPGPQSRGVTEGPESVRFPQNMTRIFSICVKLSNSPFNTLR